MIIDYRLWEINLSLNGMKIHVLVWIPLTLIYILAKSENYKNIYLILATNSIGGNFSNLQHAEVCVCRSPVYLSLLQHLWMLAVPLYPPTRQHCRMCKTHAKIKMYMYFNWKSLIRYLVNKLFWAAAVAQWFRAFAPQAESWVFGSQPRQTQVAETGSDSSTAKRSA